MKKRKPQAPLGQAVLDYVNQHGKCSIGDVAAALGYRVPAAQAGRTATNWFAAARRKGDNPQPRTTRELIRQGQRIVISYYLKNHVASGRMVRVRKGVYAPKPPQIYQPQGVAS